MPVSISRSSAGPYRALEFVVDTGFGGWLALPTDMIQALGLTYRRRRPAAQVIGQVWLNCYSGHAVWHGEDKELEIIESDGECLLGAALLRGSKLTANFRPGGAVLIEEE